MKKTETIGYNITTDAHFMDEQNSMTPELENILDVLHDEALEGRKSSIAKFLKLIEKHPKNPQLKNYLSVLYQVMNEVQKAHEVNHWIVAEHPNYLFGKVNLAFEHYSKEEYEKMPEILGQGIEVKALYPERDLFHLVEVITMHKAAVFYFGAVGDLEQAETRLEIMKDLAPDALDTEQAQSQFFADCLMAGQERYEEEQKNAINVKVSEQAKTSKTDAPTFIHPEIEILYQKGLLIEKETLNLILNLPRATLIKDLETVLEDSVQRFTHFEKIIEESGWDEETMNFVIHALVLLGELKATESLPKVLQVFSQSPAYCELYLGDFLTEVLWESVYKIANNQMESLKDFMRKPGIYTYSKAIIAEVAGQIVLYQPGREEEVRQWFDELFQFYLNCNLKDNILDSDLIGLMIGDIDQLNVPLLLPKVKRLFDNGLVNLGICGTYEDVVSYLKNEFRFTRKRTLMSISDRYDQITTTWAGYTEEDEEYKAVPPAPFVFDEDEYFDPSAPFVREQKIGRNEPCPCGSGKKYKKCCL
jgi:tetratricopeptide (TPR) repeat protein